MGFVMGSAAVNSRLRRGHSGSGVITKGLLIVAGRT